MIAFLFKIIKLFIIISFLAIVGGIAMAWYLYDPQYIKAELTDRVYQKTQRVLRIDGDINIALYPLLGVQINQATLSEPMTTGQVADQPATFAAIKKLVVGVQLQSIIQKLRFEVDALRLEQAEINVIRDADGGYNFDDLLQQSSRKSRSKQANTTASTTATAANPASTESTSPSATVDRAEPKRNAHRSPSREHRGLADNFVLNGLEIADSQITFDDQLNRQEFVFKGLSLSVGQISADASGKLHMNAQIIDPKTQTDVTARLTSNYRLELAKEAPVKRVMLNQMVSQVTGRYGAMRQLNVQLNSQLTLVSRATNLALEMAQSRLEGRWLSGDKQVKVELMTDPWQVADVQNVTLALEQWQGTYQESIGKASISAKLKGDLHFDRQQLTIGKYAADITAKQSALPEGVLQANLGGNINVDLDKQSAKGLLIGSVDQSNINVNWQLTQFAKPVITVDAEVDRLNLDRYRSQSDESKVTRPAQAAEAKPSVAAASPANAASTSTRAAKAESSAASEDDVNATAVDLSFLQALRLTGDLAVERFQVSNMAMTALFGQVNIADNRLVLEPFNAKLYGGEASGQMTINGDNNTINLNKKLTQVRVHDLITAVSREPSLLQGIGDVVLNLQGSGQTVGDFRQSLQGDLAIKLSDGALRGMNIGKALRQARGLKEGSKQALQKAKNDEKTDFSALTTQFTIDQGIASSDDLLLKSPLLRVTGGGKVDLVSNALDYTLNVNVVETSKGQGGDELETLRGLLIPVHVHGPLAAIDWQIDYKALAKGVSDKLLKSQLQAEKDKQKARLNAKIAKKKAELKDKVDAKKAQLLKHVAPKEDEKEALKQKLEDKLKKSLGGLLK